jgi:hypothetical protein
MKKMRIRIGKDGKSTLQVEGVAGPGCLELTKAFEEALGEVEERQLTEAYHQEVSESVDENLEETL